MGKRPYGFYDNKKFEAGFDSGSSKKPMVEKTQSQGQSGGKTYNGIKGQKCDKCMGPNAFHECK